MSTTDILTYKVFPGPQITAISGASERPVTVLKWGNSPDLALSVLCDLIGEQPSPKKIAQENFKAAAHLSAFRRAFGRGFDLRPGQEIGAIAAKVWLRQRGVKL